MSAFSGRQGRGARRRLRVERRLDAEERAADFEKDVARISVEQNIDLDEARWPAAASRRLSRLMAEEIR